MSVSPLELIVVCVQLTKWLKNANQQVRDNYNELQGLSQSTEAKLEQALQVWAIIRTQLPSASSSQTSSCVRAFSDLSNVLQATKTSLALILPPLDSNGRSDRMRRVYSDLRNGSRIQRELANLEKNLNDHLRWTNTLSILSMNANIVIMNDRLSDLTSAGRNMASEIRYAREESRNTRTMQNSVNNNVLALLGQVLDRLQTLETEVTRGRNTSTIRSAENAVHTTLAAIEVDDTPRVAACLDNSAGLLDQVGMRAEGDQLRRLRRSLSGSSLESRGSTFPSSFAQSNLPRHSSLPIGDNFGFRRTLDQDQFAEQFSALSVSPPDVPRQGSSSGDRYANRPFSSQFSTSPSAMVLNDPYLDVGNDNPFLSPLSAIPQSTYQHMQGNPSSQSTSNQHQYSSASANPYMSSLQSSSSITYPTTSETFSPREIGNLGQTRYPESFPVNSSGGSRNSFIHSSSPASDGAYSLRGGAFSVDPGRRNNFPAGSIHLPSPSSPESQGRPYGSSSNRRFQL